MQHKLCLWLAALLLLGALAVGNPFLSVPACAGPAGAISSSASDPERAVEPIAAPMAPPRVQPVALVSRGVGSAPDAGRPDAAGRTQGLNPLAEPARTKRSFSTPAMAKAVDASSKRPAPACPDPELQALVVRVDYRNGKPIWVLRDGRQLWRNENLRAGEPLLVPVAAADD